MIGHYLKIAWRNLLKYKSQSIISILGLAIGFTAFSFTMSWIRYEMGYDSFNPHRDQIYMVVKVDKKAIGGLAKRVPEALASYLKNTFSEVEASTMVGSRDFKIKESVITSLFFNTDTSFFSVFYPDSKIQFPDPLPQNGISFTTQSFYNVLKKSELPDSLLMHYTILPERSTHSNVAYDVINIRPYQVPNERYSPWVCYGRAAYIRVFPGTNIRGLQEKLDSIYIEDSLQGVMSYKLIPLKKAHYIIPNDKANIKFGHLRIFAAVALLVILCALFNYMMSFINRIKIRNRELALRKVNGGNNRQLLALLFYELLLVLFISLFIGGVLTELLFPFFTKLSHIDAAKGYFAREMVLYAMGLLIVFGLMAFVPVLHFMKKSIRENIQPETIRYVGFKNRFTLISVALQLTIGTLLIFCTVVFFYQMWLLNDTDIGLNRHNINQINMWAVRDPILLEEVKSIAGVEDAIYFPQTFLPRRGRAGTNFVLDKGTPSEREQKFELFNVDTPDFFTFFDINLLEGRWIEKDETGVCIINETAKKLLGIESPVGKKLEKSWTIVGVIPDLYIDSPLLPVLPSIYRSTKDALHAQVKGESIAYKYSKNARLSTEKMIEAIVSKKENFSYNKVYFMNMDDVYNEYTKSERYLLMLLGIMTAVAILIAIFGIYSMITLMCNQRRKEIAIRKVNGARVKEILVLFYRQYFWVTVLAFVVAFPMGVHVMRRWLEQYTRRVAMEWWLFAGVFVLITFIVFLSIFFRVWKAARENPINSLNRDL